LGRQAEEATVFLLGCAHFADRTAVDAGARYTREKAAVKAGIARFEGEVASIGIKARGGGGHG
jgi:hypothetical protein